MLVFLLVLILCPFGTFHFTIHYFHFYFSLSSYILFFVIVIIIVSFFVLQYSLFYIGCSIRSKYFFSLLVFFIWVMLLLLLSSLGWAFLLFWDLLGVSSFFMILYYFSRASSYSSLFTGYVIRLGDFFVAITLLALSSDYVYLWAPLLFVVCLYISSMTKSAQYPLGGWLARAIEAPTPASALVHSSTLVTAGLLLFFKTDSLLVAASWGLVLIPLTSLFVSGFSSLFELDIKKLVALSTLSQISFCFLASSLLMLSQSYVYILSHALIKSALFIFLGYLIWASQGRQDVRYGRHHLPHFIYIGLLVSMISLMGLFFTGGAISKEVLLISLTSLGMPLLFFYILFLSVLFTFLYSFRLLRGLLSASPSYLVVHSSVSLTLSTMVYFALFILVWAFLSGYYYLTPLFIGPEIFSWTYLIFLGWSVSSAANFVFYLFRQDFFSYILFDSFFFYLPSFSVAEAMLGKILIDMFLVFSLLRSLLLLTTLSGGSLYTLGILGALWFIL